MLPPYTPKNALERWAPGALICLVTVIAYIPSLDNKFVSWDDDHYLYNNQQVILPDGIKSGLFDVFYYSERKFRGTRSDEEKDRVSHQYYPLVMGMYWLEFRLYERLFDEPVRPHRRVDGIMFNTMNPDVAAGFHVTSVILHCLCVFLLIKLLRSLGMSTWVASTAAALFALTPVNVASVAWAAERKNMLSMMFYMLAMLSYLRFRRIGGWYWYAGCILLHQCALFSKTVAVTFPVMLVLTDRLIDGRWTVISLVRALPMAAQSAVAAGITIKVEDRERTHPYEGWIRLLIIPDCIRFYVQKSLVPTALLPVYALWDKAQDSFRSLLSAIGLLVAAWAAWHWRRRIPGHMYWAAALFLVTQGPLLGFRNINYFQFAFVADHYFYHGGIGLFVLIALTLGGVRGALGDRSVRHLVTILVAALALTFAALTYARCDDWQDIDSFWYKTVTGNRDLQYEAWQETEGFWEGTSGNRDCWPAYYNLANQAVRDKDVDKAATLYAEAIAAYRRSGEGRRELWQAYDRLLPILLGQRRFAEVETMGRQFLEWIPDHGEANYYTGLAYDQQGKFDEAEECYKKMLRVRSPNARYRHFKSQALTNLARIYLTVEDKLDEDKAVDCLEKALQLNPDNRAARELMKRVEQERQNRRQ
ncbi:MAG: tetratricopeptide repeat protein [Phycisphaerales bacterium]|nr:MAG: tetratricopeptide repeat protein [Phycisphaerales bacterium]